MPKGDIKHYFSSNQAEMTDGCDLWEVVTPGGERVATASNELKARELEMELNLALTDAAEADSDIDINIL